jgi:hypothetical protein
VGHEKYTPAKKRRKNELQLFQYLWIPINVLMFGLLLTLKVVASGRA